jgi:hypothetical protein
MEKLALSCSLPFTPVAHELPTPVNLKTELIKKMNTEKFLSQSIAYGSPGVTVN